MSKYIDIIKGINEKNSLASNKPSKPVTLTPRLFKDILSGLLDEKPHKLIANELNISRALINDIIQECEIEHEGRIRTILMALESEIEFNKPRVGWDKKKAETKTDIVQPKTTAEPFKSKNLLDSQTARKNSEKRIGNKTLIPEELEKKFSEDIEFGFRRIINYYGEGSDLNLTNEELKVEIIRRRHDLENDKEFFNAKKIEG